MADQTFDVVVIGAGSAGENAADRAASAGLDVAVIERELVGGACSYWACIPSKTLLRPGEVLAAARRVPGARAAVTDGVDVDATLRSRDVMIKGFDDSGQAEWLASIATLLRGHARLTGERTLTVTAADGTEQTLEARRAVVVATGSTAATPPIDGLDEVDGWDSRDATTAKEVPDRLLILGGGVVAVEMAQAWHGLGAEVTVVQRGERLLGTEEDFVGPEIASAFRDAGITVVTGAQVTAVRRDGTDGPVTATVEDGREFTADEVLVALGRKVNTRDVGLDTVGLEPGAAIDVDDHLRATGVEGGWLYAVGDVNGRALLTHMGKYQARIAGDVIAGREVPEDAGGRGGAWADHHAVVRVIFTDPQVAAVGLTEVGARDAGLDVRSVSYGTGGVAGASITGQGYEGTGKLVIDNVRDVVVGATFTGPGIGEMLHAASIAIAGQVPLSALWHAVPAFPTVSEVWLRLLEADGR